MAANVQTYVGASATSPQGLPSRHMKSDFQIRFTAGLLILLTTAAVVLGVINFQKEREFQVPYDGIWCTEKNGVLTVSRIEPDSPGAKAGIQVGDQLTAINHREVSSTPALERQLYRLGPWSKATYTFIRQSVPVDTSIILAPADRSLFQWQRLIAVIYLGIGLYVLLRRWTAPASTHFYIFCLVSFILYSFHYTSKLNQFDWTIYWSNVVAWLLQPALFLHFVLVFPEKLEVAKKHRWSLALIYIPGAVLLTIRLLAFRFAQATENLRVGLDRIDMAYQATFFIAAATILWYSYERATNAVLRQQLKWVKRGMVYFLAAAAIVGLYFAVVAGIVELVRTHVPSFGSAGQILTIVVTALLFDQIG